MDYESNPDAFPTNTGTLPISSPQAFTTNTGTVPTCISSPDKACMGLPTGTGKYYILNYGSHES